VDALITVLAGDGIGPEVAAAGTRVLEHVGESFGHSFRFSEQLIGGAAIDATGNPFPDETKGLCSDSDAILLGAVGGPKWSDPNARIRPEQGLLALRAELGVFANLRPVTIFDELASASPIKQDRLQGVDLMVVRELTGGIYFGDKTRDAESASDLCTYHRHEIERIVRVAARLAQGRKGNLCSVDKANVLETSRLWRDVCAKTIADEFSDLNLEHILVDAAAMHLINRPDGRSIDARRFAGDVAICIVGRYDARIVRTDSRLRARHRRPGDRESLRHDSQCRHAAPTQKALRQAIANGARTADLATGDERVLSTDEMTGKIIEHLG
jgi:3-isopropylmalate dehydrogenase